MNTQAQEPVLPEERRHRLLELLRRNGKIVATEVSQLLAVSEDTVRRDLNELAAAGLLRRVHGGALPVLPLTPAAAPFAVRLTEDVAARDRLGKTVAALIRPGETVLLDGGTTMLAVARHLAPDLQATIITPNLPAAMALIDHPGIEIVMLGGRVDKTERVSSGITAWEALKGLSVDLCLLGVCAIDADAGMSEMTLDDARLKRCMMSCASRVATAVTGNKLGTRAPFPIGPISGLTHLITEGELPADRLTPYRDAGIDVRIAG
ncbi:DeoR/GlpR family DNA-binding transcription regulator [Dongia soli]|uniref:DeoR/GlpR family DNA-binding transcription regulator n=1 Tax=Dongia soli TaxID=600628 RepID=A0ABU5EAG5_9PROT|nr:DeoR/GlpR family DNA-binding transcription regulator [Dongia soli]MDY0883336.1 DeoR/GlpR family DNA-binding transcription regulator [Dongia soli]